MAQKNRKLSNSSIELLDLCVCSTKTNVYDMEGFQCAMCVIDLPGTRACDHLDMLTTL